MTIEEIKARIHQVEGAIFYEQMADFMDWRAYYELKAELNKLQAELKKLEGAE